MAHVGSQVRAMYDFSGEPGTAELSIIAGETLTLTRHDVGEGWWEGMNESGHTGLFPAAYVEQIQSLPPAMPPPPLPEAFTDNWGSTDQQSTSQTQSFEGGDYWEDDDWDDDLENAIPSTSHGSTMPSQPTFTSKQGNVDDDVSTNSLGFDWTILGSYSSHSITAKGENRGTVGKKNFNRFSGFGKSGLDSFIVNTTKLDVSESEKIFIKETEDGIVWNPITDHYSCIVAAPKKESKLKGLKSFIAYQITPTFNNIQVSRRYKHFDWLHERLGEKFSLIPIPPLPDKQISGRYEEQFIKHRRVQLQAFVNSVCRHPVLSRCSVWQHFMTCTDEKRWKSGKRKEEKDKLLGANFLFALEVPDRPLDMAVVEQETENCARFIHSMDGAVKSLMATAADQAKKHQGPYKREYQKIGQAFLALGLSFDNGSSVTAETQLTKALKFTGETYNDIGLLFEDQPKLDWEPLGDVLHIYKGIITSFPDILAVHRGAIQKRKDCEKQTMENKMEEYQMQEVKRRTDLVSYALLAEINHFHSERTEDFRLCMKGYLTEQINFYQKIVNQLQDALEAYDE